MKLKLYYENKDDPHSNPQVFKFRTNARKIILDYHVDDKKYGYFPHVGIAAQEGIMTLYKKDDDESWLNVEASTPRYNNTLNMHHLVDGKEEYDVLLYGPILSRIKKLEVEVPEESTASLIPEEHAQRILLVGGLNSFGIGCTTQAFTLSALLTRKLDAHVDSLTYNYSNYLELVNRHYTENLQTRKYDIGIIEVDYVNQKDEITKKYVKEIVEKMKTHCNTVICWYCIPKYKSYKKENINEILGNLDDIILEDYSFLYDKEYVDICTFSGNFINDSGNMMIFKKLEELIIEEILLQELLGGK